MIRWNEEKAKILLEERGIDIHEIALKISEGDFLELIESPSQENHPGQGSFVIKIDEYIHLVPFVMEDSGDLFIKTVFPSRKLNEFYKEKK